MTATADPATRSLSIVSSDEELFRALSKATPDETRQIHALLVSRHSVLVRWLAARYSGRGVPMDDLRQIGFLGLMLAIRRFDVERGHDFTAFAAPTVRGEIRRYFRDRRRWIRLPRRLQELTAALRVAEERLSQSLGRWPTVPELAVYLTATEGEVREAMAADESYEVGSLDSPTSADSERALTLPAADPRMDLIIDCVSVRLLIEELTVRDRRILHLRFFEGKSQTEIAAQLGISQMHVSRRLARMMSDLQLRMAATLAEPQDARPSGVARQGAA